MRSSSEDDPAGQYRQCLEAYAPQAADFGGQRWAWLDGGSGDETIILLPGFMGQAETSFLYILALSAQARVISVSYPASVGRVDELCDGLRALMDVLKIQEATMLGGSSSGFIAQAFARRHRKRVNGLILTHTGLPGAGRARTARITLGLLGMLPFGLVQWLMQLSIYTYFPRRTRAQAFWREHFRGIIRRQSLESLRNRFALMADFHTHYRFQPGDLRDWQGKILIMEMRRDHLTSPSEQAAMREVYPGARVHVFSEAAHYDSVEQPEEQILVIRDFLGAMRT